MLATGFAYVSLAPSSVPTGVAATVTNRDNGVVVTTALLNGGFDPVAIGANVGDTLEVDITTNSGGRGVVGHARLVIAARRPPRIVRTNPPNGGRDVPLNSIMVVVFSEPVDSAGLSSGVGLRVRDTVSVSGGVDFADAQQVSVAFQPADQLAPLTTYQLVVTQSIRDLNGIALDSAAVVTFTTGTGSPIIAFQSSHGIEEIGADGSGRAVLIADSTAFQPAWSPDGARLAFARWHVADSVRTCEIFTVRADGSDERQITTPLTQPWCAWSPAWSPDGTKIAFTAGLYECVDGMYCERGSIYVVNADGSNERQLLTRGSLPPLTPRFSNFTWVGLSFPKWSPDGRMIAFTCDATNGGDDLWWVCIGAAGGSGVTRLPDLVAESPSWSPDGSEIASSSDSTQGIILRNADGSGVARTLTTALPCPCSFYDFDPAWSPDGTHLVFTRTNGGDRFFPPLISDLFIINPDGTGLRRLTTTNDASRPTWRSASR